MSRALGEIDWNRMEYAIPAFITVVMMPLTYSIANGPAISMLFSPIVLVAKGVSREVHPPGVGAVGGIPRPCSS
ncbi:hypothetical protein [Nocardia arizonensis]|uniref:hypothetical protein n=1 Tax=Nocardia arizonensis TaxID=1141647 RepID=UPI000AAE8262|nr:hypothetical protein [Nocardia arizonensis]